MSLKKEEREVSTEDRLAANATAGKPCRLRQLPTSAFDYSLPFFNYSYVLYFTNA